MISFCSIMPSSNPAYTAIELDVFISAAPYPQGSSRSEAAEPLLLRSDSPPSNLQSSYAGDRLFGSEHNRLLSLFPTRVQWSGNMGRFGDSKAARLLRKLEVDSEPGLTNAQMFLTNHDLKPVEQERRKWGNWNFVGGSWNPFALRCRISP